MRQFWAWRQRKLRAKFDRLVEKSKKQQHIYGRESDWIGWRAIQIIHGLRRCSYYLDKTRLAGGK